MAEPLAGRCALVTGASRGIGRAIALKLARDGADVVVSYFRHPALAEETVAAITALGRRATALRADLGEPDDIARLCRAAGAFLGGIDILVCNVAFGVLRPALALEVKHWQRTLDTMGRSLLLLAQAALPWMEGRGDGRIISLTSLGSHRVIPSYAAVGAAKAVLDTLTRYLAVELAPKGIIVNAVAGGVVDTDALRALPEAATLLEAARQRTPLGRVGRPEDIADVVALLCRPEARWIVGQVIVADGGYSLLA
jgi:enoyl-[acyl-carrier protein] reductase III